MSAPRGTATRGTFLQRKPLLEARELLLAGIGAVADEELDVETCVGRISSCNVVAAHPSPHYRASAMDGLAVRAADTWAAADGPLVLSVAGEQQNSAAPLCLPVDTGSLLPDWADAVIRIEDATAVDRGYRIGAVVPPGRDVRRAGEDIEAGTLLIAGGSLIRPVDVGALLATGVTRVRVRKRPRVAILATGAEVVEPTVGAGPGQVIEYNSRVLAGLIEEWGGSAHRLGIVADNESSLAGAVTDAARRFDAVGVIAGSSAGRKDFTVAVLASLGEVFVHGVDIAPGRPVALARIGSEPTQTTPVIAIPGYPVAALVVAERLLKPLLAALLGRVESAPVVVRARVGRKIPSRLGMEEFRRICLTTQTNAALMVAPLPSGAGSISTVTTAHAWLRIAATCEGIDAGSEVDVELIVPESEVRAAFVMAGPPCEESTELEARLKRRSPATRVAHLRLGTIDALDAVECGLAHAAWATEEEISGRPLELRPWPGSDLGLAVVRSSAGDRALGTSNTTGQG